VPYITKQDREYVKSPISAGQLNYFITRLCHQYLSDLGVSYQNINSVIGALECAKLELYSEIARPYEMKKKYENGSVSTLDA
jgi:hypothetical protein